MLGLLSWVALANKMSVLLLFENTTQNDFEMVVVDMKGQLRQRWPRRANCRGCHGRALMGVTNPRDV